MCLNVLIAAISAQVSITTIPEVPLLGDDVTLLCQVETEELLRATGMVFLQLANGNIVSDRIQSPTTAINFRFLPLANRDAGRYFCNVSITSPEFPETGLRAFKDITLLNSSKYTTANSSMEYYCNAAVPTSSPMSSTINITPSPSSVISATTTPVVLESFSPAFSMTSEPTTTVVIPGPVQTTSVPGTDNHVLLQYSIHNFIISGSMTASGSSVTPTPVAPTTTTTTTTIPSPKPLVIFVVIDVSFLLLGRSYNLICRASEKALQLYYRDVTSVNLCVGKITERGGNSRKTLLLVTSATNQNVDQYISWTFPVQGKLFA